jgi:choline dehydrogenase-like flavoprotein
MDEPFQLVVVGGGIGGSAAALRLLDGPFQLRAGERRCHEQRESDRSGHSRRGSRSESRQDYRGEAEYEQSWPLIGQPITDPIGVPATLPIQEDAYGVPSWSWRCAPLSADSREPRDGLK